MITDGEVFPWSLGWEHLPCSLLGFFCLSWALLLQLQSSFASWTFSLMGVILMRKMPQLCIACEFLLWKTERGMVLSLHPHLASSVSPPVVGCSMWKVLIFTLFTAHPMQTAGPTSRGGRRGVRNWSSTFKWTHSSCPVQWQPCTGKWTPKTLGMMLCVHPCRLFVFCDRGRFHF